MTHALTELLERTYQVMETLSLVVTLPQGTGTPWHLESYLALVVMVISCSVPYSAETEE